VESSGDVRISRTRQHLGERLHSIIMRGYGLRERDFSHACADRIMPALNAARAHVEPVQAEVLWLGGSDRIHVATILVTCDTRRSGPLPRTLRCALPCCCCTAWLGACTRVMPNSRLMPTRSS